ncbi:unnamed protein product [Sphagnum balticum]
MSIRVMKLVLFALVLLSSAVSSNCEVIEFIYQENEINALHTIFGDWNQSTPNIATNLPGWNPNTNPYPCFNEEWKGVLCVRLPIVNSSNINTIVVALILDDASIVGNLPSAIGDLTNLVVLSLTRNPRLTGPIPAEIDSLTSLQILDLHDNNFNGTIPGFTNPWGLQQIDLSGNQLTGAIPNFGNTRWLDTLKLSGNQLSGPSPVFLDSTSTGLANLTFLTTLDLSNNLMLSGSPPDLTTMPMLQYLNLSMNKFGGPIEPASIFNPSSNLKVLDLSRNNFSGPLPDFGLFSTSLQQLDLSYNGFNSPQVPTWLSGFNQLQTLALSGCGLIGSFPYQLASSFPQLQTMNLDNNNFNGTLYIGNISGLSRKLPNGTIDGHLQSLNLTETDISYVDYNSSDITDVTTTIILENSTYCSKTSLQTNGQRCYCAQNCFVILDTSNNNTRKVILISTITSGIVLALIIAITTCLFWKSRQRQRYLLLQLHERFAQHEVQPTIFGYTELKAATRDFHPTMKLGEGSFGVVYKGIFANGVEVAIKQLLVKTQKNIDEFLNEVVIISGVKHRNLVKLKGCCLRDNKRLLVYEYLENGDLANLLFGGQNNREVLFWPTRFNICLGIARGLHYLHDISQPRIIHRDIKASNILLDKKLQPKIADFGLAFLFPDDKSHISTMHVAGTRGYLAPEYATRGQLTIKVDVYSFGVLLLEIISGRKNIDHSLPLEDIYLVEKAWRLHNEGNLIDIIDQTLHLCNDEVIQARQLLNIALLCLLHEGEKRPSMAHVVAMLQGEVESECVENELKLGKSIIKSIKTSFSAIRSTIEISRLTSFTSSSTSSTTRCSIWFERGLLSRTLSTSSVPSRNTTSRLLMIFLVSRHIKRYGLVPSQYPRNTQGMDLNSNLLLFSSGMSPSSELLFFGTSCVAQKRRRRSKCCLWSCTTTLHILCSAAPQTNKQNKHKKKMFTWVLRGSSSSRSKLQARSRSTFQELWRWTWSTTLENNSLLRSCLFHSETGHTNHQFNILTHISGGCLHKYCKSTCVVRHVFQWVHMCMAPKISWGSPCLRIILSSHMWVMDGAQDFGQCFYSGHFAKGDRKSAKSCHLVSSKLIVNHALKNLDNNNFSGALAIGNISSLIMKLPNGSNDGHLQYLIITNNHISNVEYTSYDIIEVITIIMLENNSYCLGKSLQTDGQRCYCSQNCLIISGDNNKKNIEVILISTLVSGSIVTLVIVITIYLFWRNKRKQQYLLLQIQEKFAEFEVQPTIFGYNELKVATRDFHPTMKLGEGSFGVVYKGILANGIEVAIKQLLIKNQQNIDEFLNEVVIITGVKHRNLVKLKGCCLRDNKRLLVYEYLENGDLAKVLFERNGVDISFWPTRFNICLGIAHGLFYLHEIAQPRIIHRDIKASNILLDKRLQPKIADFGLALLFADDETHISTMHVAGTRGYLAPEYATCGQLTIKADVYSFGVLILEIISGRKCIDDELPPNDTYLLEKAWRLHNEGNLIDIVDQTLHLCNDEVIQARQLLNIALLCLLNEGEKRPSMVHVVAMLQGEVEPERVENELKLGKSVIKSIKTSFSTIRSTIEISKFEVQPTIFGYNELKVATRDFHPTMKLGEGSFGVVYKGILANGIEVAIKQLLIKNQQNIDEFLNEVVIITGVKHRNLVKLKGCCLRDNKRLLVYEYLENGDLAKVLFERNGVDISFWPTRFNICLGIAHGLFYLHEIAQPRIIHRDIKASNILLDKRLQPKIADFGLALLFADDKTHISTMHVAGTRGYLAPEYATCGQLTIKADVYSFGVLILEIISGRKCIDHELPPNDTYLLEKAWRLHNEGNLIDIVDQTLHLCNDEMNQARQLLNIALLCLLNEGEKRPTMAHVVAMLQGEVESERQAGSWNNGNVPMQPTSNHNQLLVDLSPRTPPRPSSSTSCSSLHSPKRRKGVPHRAPLGA